MKVTRRDLFRGAAGSLALGLGGCQSWPFGAGAHRPAHRPWASERVNLAVVGCGTQGFENMKVFLQDPRVQVTCVCDPVARAPKYSYKAEATLGRDVFAESVNAFYKTRGCRTCVDFREVMDDSTIDAVLIATPDHWHAIQCLAAMRAGKHVFVQKPLTFALREGQALVRAARESGVTFQVGSQQRSASEFRVAAELVASGYLGTCRSCEIGLPGGCGGVWGHEKDTRRLAIPSYFTPETWNLWQGPAEHWPDNAFIPGIHEPMCWRWNARTGGGQITDWGAHHFDILQWTLGMDKGGPVAIENMKSDYPGPGAVFSWASNYSFDVVYANGFRAHVSNRFPNGLRFRGEKGELFVKRGRLDRPEHLRKWNEKKDLKAGDVHLHRSRGSHEMDFIDAVYSGNATACPCETGHRAITIAHLANACERLGLSGLTWDPLRETCSNAAVEPLLSASYHNGWHLDA